MKMCKYRVFSGGLRSFKNAASTQIKHSTTNFEKCDSTKFIDSTRKKKSHCFD